MSWAPRLKRVSRLDLENCEGCGGQIRVIACLDDPLVIARILSHRDQQPPPLLGWRQRKRDLDRGRLGSEGFCAADWTNLPAGARELEFCLPEINGQRFGR